MKITPVVAIHIPFGGDNHRDVGLATETKETLSGVATLASLMQQLAAAGLQDQVTFVSLNVFGRTLGRGSADGRQHNSNHQVSITIGKPFKGGVVGGVMPVAGDFGCMPVDSKTGAGAAGGDILPVATLPSFARTVLSGLGVDAASIATDITSGTTITTALA